jgi:hypothetical protein
MRDIAHNEFRVVIAAGLAFVGARHLAIIEPVPDLAANI